MKNSYNYRTFYTGTPKNLEECPIIYFLSTGDLDFNLSLENLDKLKEVISEIKNPIFCIRGKNGNFTKSLKGFSKFSFNLIVYCNSSISSETKINPIIGYTVFSEPQRTYTNSGNTFGELVVSVSFERNEDKDSGVIIEILNTFKIIQSEVNLRGELGFNYPIQTDNIKIPEEYYIRYSGKVSDIKNDESLISLTECGVIYESGRYYSKLFIQQGLNIDSDMYTNYYLGTYNNDLVICRYNKNDGNYCISSLSKLNRFGKLYDYVSGCLDIELVKNCEILYYSYSYLVFWNDYKSEYIIYFLEDNNYEIVPRNNETVGNSYIIINLRDPNGKHTYMSDIELFEEIKKTCITPIKYISGKYIVDLNRKDYIYNSKIGSWWELYKPYSDLYYYLSPYGCVISSSKMTLINDRLFKTPDNIFFPIEFGHTYKYPVHKYPRDLTTIEKVGIKIKTTDLWENLDRTSECLLDGLRRKPIRSKYCFPNQKEIIGSLYGIIFYIENGLLYCY